MVSQQAQACGRNATSPPPGSPHLNLVRHCSIRIICQIGTNFVCARSQDTACCPSRNVRDFLVISHLGLLHWVNGSHGVNGLSLAEAMSEDGEELVCHERGLRWRDRDRATL